VDEAVVNAMPPQDLADALQAQQLADEVAALAGLNLNDDTVRQLSLARCPPCCIPLADLLVQVVTCLSCAAFRAAVVALPSR